MTLFETYLSDEIYCSIVPRSLILYFSSEQGYSYLCCTIVIKTEIHYWPFFVPASLQAVCMCQCSCPDSIEKHCTRSSLCPGKPTLSICFKKFRPIFSNFVFPARFLTWHEKINLCNWTWESLGPTYFILRVQFFFFTSAECLESSLACVTIVLLSTKWHDHGRYNWEELVNALLQVANTC